MEKISKEGEDAIKRLALEMRYSPKKYPEFHNLMKSIIKNNELYEKWVKGGIEINFEVDENSIPSFEQWSHGWLDLNIFKKQ